jgi:HEAT repeat protein
LTEALVDRDDFVREWAAYALTSIGSAAASAVPALVERLDDQEPAVRQAASDALVSI